MDFTLNNPSPRGKHYVKPRGYAAQPGTGPIGMKCKNCAHYAHKENVAGNYPKCGLMRKIWTGGRATDILANSPACHLFKQQEGGE